jgi:hypothetical protein
MAAVADLRKIVASKGLRLLALIVGVVAASAVPPTAKGSLVLGDRNVRDPSLVVGADGVAVVSYTTTTGRLRHVLAWGAINGYPHQMDPPVTQAHFKLDYSGGWKSHGRATYWETIHDACSPYTGPALPFFVAGCTAPDGSYWALQRWQRNLPIGGFAPWTDAQKSVELHLSHWSGPLPMLEIYRHWTYGQTLQGFFGRLTYLGGAVYGTRTASASVNDTFARNISIDVFDSDFGSGWRHDTAISTDSGSGGFCFSFVAQAPPAGYPSSKPNGNGLGTRYRVSVSGPGVTPIVQWAGPSLTSHEPAQQSAATQAFDRLLGSDTHCAAER